MEAARPKERVLRASMRTRRTTGYWWWPIGENQTMPSMSSSLRIFPRSCKLSQQITIKVVVGSQRSGGITPWTRGGSLVLVWVYCVVCVVQHVLRSGIRTGLCRRIYNRQELQAGQTCHWPIQSQTSVVLVFVYLERQYLFVYWWRSDLCDSVSY